MKNRLRLILFVLVMVFSFTNTHFAEDQSSLAKFLIRNFDPHEVPTVGSSNPDYVIVEFFDYNCGYCRQAGKTIQALIASDPNVRVIFREWPVLGEGSTFAARAVLASSEQGKYEEFHWALMNGKVRATKAVVMKVARDLGLDIAKLEADMVSQTVDLHLEQSNMLAQNLGFTGTPAFIVDNQKVPGMLSFNQISELVAEARDTK